MKLLLTLIKSIFLVIALVVLHVFMASYLPYPFSSVNVILAILILRMFLNGGGTTVWYAFAAFFVVEQYRLGSFGLMLTAGTVGMLFTYWQYLGTISNRSWISLAALTILGVVFYRVIYTVLLIFSEFTLWLPWKSLLTTYMWELLFTTVLSVILYGITHKYVRKIQRMTGRIEMSI